MWGSGPGGGEGGGRGGVTLRDITLCKADSLYVAAAVAVAAGHVYTVQVNTACGAFVNFAVLAFIPNGFAEIF